MKFEAFQTGFSISANGTEASVREMLARLRDALRDQGIGADLCGTVEIALAEALNNIVEHAYSNSGSGPVELVADLGSEELKFRLRDHGHALPGLKLPEGKLPDKDVPLDDLPEGGFGWYLLHSLTESLSYTRDRDENCLTLVFAAK